MIPRPLLYFFYSDGEDKGVMMEQELVEQMKCDDHAEEALVMLEEAKVGVMVEERASQDMDGSMSSTVGPQTTTSTRRAVAPTIARRISELQGGTTATGSPGTSGTKTGSGRKKKKVLDLSNCQKIDEFISAMGGRKAKRKNLEDDQEEGPNGVKRMRGPPGT